MNTVNNYVLGSLIIKAFDFVWLWAIIEALDNAKVDLRYKGPPEIYNRKATSQIKIS